MGIGHRRPPLPAPTESMDESTGADTEIATNITTRTDRTSYEIPEDGSPITISTHKVKSTKDGRPGHHRHKSQTSLLIEYFEGARTSDKTKSRPSVRVKVTPSSTKKSRNGGHDSIQVTSIGKDRKPSYTRRISLGSSKNAETGAPTEGTELSHSSESNLSGRPPLEIEILNHNGSDMSNGRSSRGLLYAQHESNISSMPPDSMIEGSGITDSELSRGIGPESDVLVTDAKHLKAPIRSRSRSASRDRITKKVMEKLGHSSGKPRKSSRSGHERNVSDEYDADGYPLERRRRSSKSRHDDEMASGAESSMVSSHLAPSQRSYRSGTSQGSRMTNNPKLLEMVEDTIKRMILPEINAIKEDQKSDRYLRSADGRRGSLQKDGYESSGLERRVSKSSSSPNISSKPKVVLNRDGDDPGTVLSRGDSERKKMRKSSRGSYTEERSSSRRSSGRHSGHGVRDAAAAGIAGGILTAAALKHHDSQDDVHHRRKKRSKSRSSRSRSASIAEMNEDSYMKKEDIPPLPMSSNINDSDLTRDSIVSAATERPGSRTSAEICTPVREVSRGSANETISPISSRTPTRTPVSGSKGLGTIHTNQSIESPNGGITTKDRMAALAIAGLGGAAAAKGLHDHYDHHVNADGYGEPTTTNRTFDSPTHSVSSLKKQFEEDPLVPKGLRPKSAASRSSAGRLRETSKSQASLSSPRSSPTTQKLMRSRRQSQNISGDEFVTPLERPEGGFLRESTPGTPNGESIDDWYERQHQLNDRYRDSVGGATNRDSYQTNPFPEDDKRFSEFTDHSYGSVGARGEQNVKGVGAVPIFGTPAGVESNVASLVEPSTLSSNVISSQGSPGRPNGSFAERLRELGKDDSAAMYEGSTLSQTMPSQDRWAALKGHARNMSASTSRSRVGDTESPRQSPAKSLGEERSNDALPVMSASGLPDAADPMPEIGHFDDTKSDISTNPSIIKGPLGGDAAGKSTWPYTPEPQQKEPGLKKSRSLHSGHGKDNALLVAAAGGAAALAAGYASKKVAGQDEEEGDRALTPDRRRRGDAVDRGATPSSAAAFRDEGYVTDAHARSVGAETPTSQHYSKEDLDEYHRAMDAQSIGEDDTFTGGDKHTRHLSGNSHGIAPPLYDSATGKGKDRIQSKDIVALMDHLTVRDAQRSARDTEILVTLVRSATEMRQSFDEMRRFIAEQDRLIMQNAHRDAEQTVQKVLGGPRPQPLNTPRSFQRESQEEIQAKRKGALRRALRGLTGGKKADDLARIEDMLMQVLENVEGLKLGSGVAGRQMSSYTTDTLDSYEKLRAAPDPGYEPDGQAGTSSTPSHSGHFSVSQKVDDRQFHSGYDGRRGSYNRVSTVLEGDEEDLTPDEDHLLQHQFENNERLLTPTQELQRQRGLSPSNTPTQHAATFSGGHANDLTPKTAERQRKHKSNSSSLFGVPKTSRWSKTTSSSAAPDPATLDSPTIARGEKSISEASRSGSQIDVFENEGYYSHDDDRLRSTQSLVREQQQRPNSQVESRSLHSQASRVTRTPSPLIPSESSARYEDDREFSPIPRDPLDHGFDDPKYQAVRNSLLLQHPQPRQGSTGRHQNTLENRAQDYDDPSTTNSDLSSQRTVSDFDPAMWGSSGTAALARNRMSQAEPMSPVSMGRGSVGRSNQNDGPLVPQAKASAAPPPKVYEPEPEPEPEWEPLYSNSGFSRGGYYSSPFGSGHLLEPIEEVRYSLETDSGHVRKGFTPSFVCPPADMPFTDFTRAASRIRAGGQRALDRAQDHRASSHGQQEPGAASQARRDQRDGASKAGGQPRWDTTHVSACFAHLLTQTAASDGSAESETF